jgi:hypothetical protein
LDNSTNRDSCRSAIEGIYADFERFRNMAEETECGTRVTVINRVLEAVGWNLLDLQYEKSTTAGGFVDYELSADGISWMVVEAKKSGSTFVVDREELRLRGTSVVAIKSLLDRGGNSLREVLRQGAHYCNDRGVPYCCVTNGFQWVFFKGLSQENRPWTRSKAVVFLGPESVTAKLNEFVQCIGRDWVHSTLLPRLLESNARGDLPEAVIPVQYLELPDRANPGVDLTVNDSIGKYLR